MEKIAIYTKRLEIVNQIVISENSNTDAFYVTEKNNYVKPEEVQFVTLEELNFLKSCKQV